LQKEDETEPTNITEDLKFFSSPNNFLIVTGNSSPDKIDLFNFIIDQLIPFLIYIHLLGL
jgi:hypothetical protein